MAGHSFQAIRVKTLKKGFATRIGVDFAELAAIKAHFCAQAKWLHSARSGRCGHFFGSLIQHLFAVPRAKDINPFDAIFCTIARLKNSHKASASA